MFRPVSDGTINLTAGAFMIRESTSFENSYALDVVGPENIIGHLRIDANSNNTLSLSFHPDRTFPSINDLILYYSTHPIAKEFPVCLGTWYFPTGWSVFV